ncbi:hypothetical protein DIPPA_02367 [Diplonema papillatum]|nr:hypothetical protein DIPPA_02367 [Diplonema papillatum]
MKYQSLLEKCRLRVSRFCRELCEVASVHSNVSPYVKKYLFFVGQDVRGADLADRPSPSRTT